MFGGMGDRLRGQGGSEQFLKGLFPQPSAKCDVGTREQAAADLSELHTGKEFFPKGIRSIVGLFITSQAGAATMANQQQVNNPKHVFGLCPLTINIYI